jgi:oxygen-dependent protoporphyrinogen oxidase
MSSDARIATVAVVGAGIAGLAAAWELSRRGFDVSLFEREAHPGGRVRSDSVEGFRLDAMGPLVSTGDRRLLAWIVDVGLRDELLPLRPVVALQCRGDELAGFEPRELLGICRIPGVRPLHALRLVRLPRLIARYGARIDPEAPERGADLDDRSLGDFGRLYFGRSVLAHWMAPFVTEASLGDADDLSRVLFLRRFRSHGCERPGLLRSAPGELVAAAAEKLPVQYGAEVRAVECRGDGGIALRVRGPEAERATLPDAVVVATSAPDAALLAAAALVAAERDHLAAVRYQPALSLAVGLRRPFFSHARHIHVPHTEGSPLESVLLEPGVRGGRVPDGRGLALLRATGAWSEASFDAPDEAVSKELLSAFARIHPGAESAVLFSKLYRVERAVPRFAVGRYRGIARFERVQRALRREGRRLYFAGDYLVDPSLEGALASAQRAAAAVAEDQPSR